MIDDVVQFRVLKGSDRQSDALMGEPIGESIQFSLVHNDSCYACFLRRGTRPSDADVFARGIGDRQLNTGNTTSQCLIDRIAAKDDLTPRGPFSVGRLFITSSPTRSRMSRTTALLM